VRTVALLAIALLTACTSMRSMRCGDTAAPRPPRNFGVVTRPDGAPLGIYRGGQPVTCGELAYLRTRGVKSILKLNDRGLPIDRDEEQHAGELGLTIRSFAFDAKTIGTPPTCTAVREAMAFLTDPANQPVFVHCSAGKDRTGYLVGLYEKTVLGEPTAAVVAELHRYGHKATRSAVMGQIDEELAKDTPACSGNR
jgi:protein tyrosine phosphatase (PTP) superfamily phosphohydrolase (DUF442 family)